MKNTKKGFTLAEVLITLAIIGIVAVLTMPALISNYKKVEYSSKLKKFYSTMKQGVMLSELDNGPVGEWLKEGGIRGDIEDDEENIDFDKNSEVIFKYINQYLKPYINIVKMGKSKIVSENGISPDGEAYIVFSDGSYVYLHNGNCIDFIYDVNGPEAPNEYGRDRFKFLLCSNEKCEQHNWYTGNCGTFTFNGMASENRNEALTKCKEKAIYCTELLLMDGFEFNKDYPHKL